MANVIAIGGQIKPDNWQIWIDLDTVEAVRFRGKGNDQSIRLYTPGHAYNLSSVEIDNFEEVKQQIMDEFDFSIKIKEEKDKCRGQQVMPSGLRKVSHPHKPVNGRV